MRNIAPISVIICGLAACAPIINETTGVYPKLPLAGTDTCGARKHADSLGQDITVLETQFVRQPVRMIRPDTMVTTDFIENRLNFYLNDKDQIESIACG